MGMMAAHTARLVLFNLRPEWARTVLLLEPVIPSLFLFLVGWSLARSCRAALDRGLRRRTWFARQARRALILWLVSTLFYVLELGARFPDMITASGILANIAYAIMLVATMLCLPRPRLAVVLALGGGAALFTALDAAGARVFPINIGNAPFLPLWLFAFAGALWETAARRTAWRHAAGAAGAVAAFILLERYGAKALFTAPVGRSDAGREVAAALFGGGEARHLAYYNLRPALALACLGIHLAAGSLLDLLFRRIREPAARFLFALGRHALIAYVLHLALLAVLVVAFGRQPLSSGAQTTLTWLSLILVCQFCVFFRETQKRV